MFFPLKKPMPNFEELEKVIKGEKKPQKVHLVELSVDREIMDYITRNIMHEKSFYPEMEEIRREKVIALREGKSVVLATEEKERAYYKQKMNFFCRMGYDFLPDSEPFRFLESIVAPKVKLVRDTALLSKKGGYVSHPAKKEGLREWVDEEVGIISSWEDFERFPWDRIKLNLDNYYDFLSKNLPEGMKTMLTGYLYEYIQERLLGSGPFFYLLHDDAQLVKAVTDRWGKILYDFYEDRIDSELVGGIFHGDDLGHKTGTTVSPDILREMFFPWLKKYSLLAHKHSKMFFFHSCGNTQKVMEDLIEDVGIDAFHSFQDIIIPVGQFKKRYQDRIATLGGVDVDKLARLDESNLRKYVREILDECMPGGRYALGSGNSITNYISVENYLIMLEESLNFGR